MEGSGLGSSVRPIDHRVGVRSHGEVFLASFEERDEDCVCIAEIVMNDVHKERRFHEFRDQFPRRGIGLI